jgi:cytochrome b561
MREEAGSMPDRYSRVAIGLHWLIAALIIGLLIAGTVMTKLSFVTHAEMRISLTQTHKAVGLSVLVLSLARLLWRLGHKPPALPSNMSRFERFAAKLTHIAFYGFMIGMPLLGWLMVSGYDNAISYFGLFDWPKLPGLLGNEELSALFKRSHKYMGYGGAALIALHVGAALKHHFVKKDDVLARMVPKLKRRL